MNIVINEREKYKLFYLVGNDLDRKKILLHSTSNIELINIIKDDIKTLEDILIKLKNI